MTDASKCKHYKVCGLPCIRDDFCILHAHDEDKNKDDFEKAIRAHLDGGHSDFQNVVFISTPFKGKKFQGKVDFSDAVFLYSGLNLEKAVLPKGMVLSTKDIHSINMSMTECSEDVEIKINGSLGHFNGDGAKFHKKFTMEVGVKEVEFKKLKEEKEEGTAGVTSTVSLCQGAQLDGEVVLRANFHSAVFIQNAKIGNRLNFKDCSFNGNLSFSACEFECSSELDLSRSEINGNVNFLFTTPPSKLHLDDTHINGARINIGTTLGKPRLNIIASQNSPRFEIKDILNFSNVNLSECRLLGNDLEKMHFNNVQWASRCGRNVLFDELFFRRDWRQVWLPGKFPSGNLKEAYQALKQKYQVFGDHAKAGDFHYGEMEMKRCEYGWGWRLKRVLCPEFLYWAVSGYGTGYIRAGVLLILLMPIFSMLYLWNDPIAFQDSFSEALHYSVKVMTLQQPTPPHPFTTSSGRWLETIQSIFGPIQIALFVLSLRMRVKR